MDGDDDLYSASASLQRQVSTLQETVPAQYGLLESYHETVQHALEACSRSYPSTSQLGEQLPESKLTPQMLGNLLALLVDLKVIGIHSERNNSNRYDLTHYDHQRMDTLCRVLE